MMEAYDKALGQIIKNGTRKTNRTGVDTIAVFGTQSRYRIDENFPIITGRKIWPKSIFGELLWFISGSTNNNDLEALGSKIWRPWVDSEFEKKHGYDPGEFGPTYAFQMRNFGANYKEVRRVQKEIKELEKNYKEALDDEGKSQPWSGRCWDYHCVPASSTLEFALNSVREHYETIRGFDQIAHMVKRLKEAPDCRRNLFSLWNPNDVDRMKLPPCGYTFQVFVDGNRLSGMLTQRSADFFVGSAANILSYSALIYMLSQQCGLQPYELIYSTADSHAYVNQLPMIEEYLARPKPDSPKLILHKAKDIFSYKIEDFEVVDYNPLPAIKVPVAV